LYLVDTVGGDIGLFSVLCASPDHFLPFGDSSTLQRYTKFIYNLYLVQLSHIQISFCVLNEKFQIYTLVTLIKSQS
jgi:hypothetical protein